MLLQAVLRTAAELELNRTALARVLGKDRSTLNRAQGIEPASTAAFRFSSATIAANCATGFTPLTAIPVACRPSRCSALRGWLKSCRTSTPGARRYERLVPEEIFDKINPKADEVQHNCAPKDEADGLLDCLVF